MDRFFSVVGRVDDEAEVIDLIATRYGWTIREIDDIDIVLLNKIVAEIITKKNREQALAQWTALQPLMAAGMVKNMSWQEYWARIENSKIDTRPTKEILEDIEKVRKELADGSV